MKAVDCVEVPQEAFLSMLSMDDDGEIVYFKGFSCDFHVFYLTKSQTCNIMYLRFNLFRSNLF
ncbi:hypothetical protein OfM1_20050 [Lactovum odontotermitis]